MKRLLRARPHLVVACLCVGLAGANLARGSSLAVVVAAVAMVAASAAVPSPWRLPALGVALALAGWWWGSARLDALDRSALVPRVGTAERALVAVTGPARRSQFDVRVPAQMRRFGRDEIREPVLLRLPPGRSPPQGATQSSQPVHSSATTVCTSSFARTGGESSGAVAAYPASQIGCARTWRRGWLPVSTGSGVP